MYIEGHLIFTNIPPKKRRGISGHFWKTGKDITPIYTYKCKISPTQKDRLQELSPFYVSQFTYD
jgi:hypothetical protein